MNTQKNLVLNHLREYGSITSFEAFTSYGITRLSAVIFDLRHLGYNITSEGIVTVNRFGRKVNYSKYKLVEENTDATL